MHRMSPHVTETHDTSICNWGTTQEGDQLPSMIPTKPGGPVTHTQLTIKTGV